MIKFWMTTFRFMKVAWLWCFMFHRNQKVVIQNFITELTEYFSCYSSLEDKITFVIYKVHNLRYLSFLNDTKLDLKFLNVTKQIIHRMGLLMKFHRACVLGALCKCWHHHGDLWYVYYTDRHTAQIFILAKLHPVKIYQTIYPVLMFKI